MITTCVRLTVLVYAFLFIHAHEAETNDTESCVHLYEEGVEAYLENRFADCVEYFEKALNKYRAYKKRLQNCRLKCKYETELSEPLYPVDVENLLFYEKAIKQTLCIMECKSRHPEIFGSYDVNPETEQLFEERKPYEYLHICYFQKKLSSLNGETHDDLLPSHYHYLQFTYFKMQDLRKACQAVASYLLFYPDDYTMLSNMKYYSGLPKVKDDYFQPREEAIRYVQRDIYETRILKFIETEFKSQEPVKEPPAYTWRDYSAILYLNDNFKGGEFIFSSDPIAKQVQSVVEPKCGRMVGFTSGFENLHGVKAVKQGSRCAVAIWFTLNPEYADEDRLIAYHVLENNVNFHLFSPIDVSSL
ncbi:hypothetical protein NQ318_015578 [Aromia moschata]|uniref:Prolyl 4-hydroxylase alpha subunit domain-containing protein n=1 Tax=Aromia moschata TaxID=1265417 RepID=A0AAV8XCV5_9CUCU|nr:hypothetical protein NQ318_015578 [Aromia moschata]